MHAGRLREAVALHEATLRLREAKLGTDHSSTLRSRIGLADAFGLLGRTAEAEDLLRDVVAGRRKTAKPADPSLADDLTRLARLVLSQQRGSEAEPLLREALAIRTKATPDNWVRFEAMSLLGGALAGQGRYAEAEPLVVDGFEGMTGRAGRIPAPERFRLREAAERVVRLYEGWGRPDRAADWKVKLGMPDLPADVFAGP